MSSEDQPTETLVKTTEDPAVKDSGLEVQASDGPAAEKPSETAAVGKDTELGANQAEEGEKVGTDDEDDEEDDRGERENGMEIDEVVIQGGADDGSTNVDEAPLADVTQTPSEEKEKMDTAADDSSKPLEPGSYSTRGRSGDTALDVLADAGHQREREAEIQLPREKEHAPSVKPSFLSDSLTEEERRTRTRYIPDVPDMNMLRKTEIKSDLAVAKSFVTSASVASTLAKKIRKSRDNEMDLDDSIAPADDDKASEIIRLGTRTLEVSEGLEYDLPSTAFVAPSASATNGDGARAKPNPPTAVEAVAAFNPPRPPESVGPKKKHRMLRWERRPADIEVDLTTYRKTVQKTREELKNAQLEKDRIIMLDNHLRRHFLSHLECMDEELAQISDETAKVQQDCVSAADLLTSRTRSRGAGKSSYVMRDVLTVLRARGAELKEKGISMESAPGSAVETGSGVGGVGSFSFYNWDNSKKISVKKTCSGWIVPGDRVSCPKGEGTVVKIVPYEELGEDKVAGQKGDAKAKLGTKVDEPKKKDNPDKDGAEQAKGSDSPAKLNLGELVGPRVAVEVDSNVVYFPPEDIKPLENPASFQDSRLALRWRGMMETAPLFGEALDVEALAEHLPEKAGDDEQLALDGDMGAATNSIEKQESITEPQSRSLPFGANLIPTSVGRGAFVAHAGIEKLDTTLDASFFRSTFVLGEQENPGVPQVVQEAEKKEQERIRLKARLRQLRNEVNRQRRIRSLNQRTHAATEERAVRIESLVSEMRTDLKNLKRRLDEEVRSLGIEETEADKIFQAYNSRHQSGEGLESPFKRSRSSAEMDLDTEEEMFDGQDGSGTDQATAL